MELPSTSESRNSVFVLLIAASSVSKIKQAPEEKADILVSELLGSWGDNELSPECLDGAQRFLKDGGVSIPQEYTSYVAPMSSHKLWREVSNFEELKRLETAYVVKLHNFVQLAEEKPCFTFHHPNWDGAASETHNKRHIEIEFDVKQVKEGAGSESGSAEAAGRSVVAKRR